MGNTKHLFRASLTLAGERRQAGQTQGIKALRKRRFQGFPGGSVAKDPLANVGDMGSFPGLGRAHESQSLCSRAATVSSTPEPRSRSY